MQSHEMRADPYPIGLDLRGFAVIILPFRTPVHGGTGPFERTTTTHRAGVEERRQAGLCSLQEADKHIGIAPIDKEDCLSTRGFVSGARATMMVVGTAAAVGLALVNDRRLTPVLVEAAPQTPLALVPVTGTVAVPETSPRDAFARRFGMATLIGVAVLFVAASVPAVTALVGNMRGP